MSIRKTFAERLKSARKERKVSQDTLASEIGVSRRVISDWENANAAPPLDRLEPLAQVLRKPISYFLTQPMERTGYYLEDLSQLVLAYDRALKSLRKREGDIEKMRQTVRLMITYLSGQAKLVFYGELTEAERQALEDEEDLDWSFFSKFAHHEQRSHHSDDTRPLFELDEMRFRQNLAGESVCVLNDLDLALLATTPSEQKEEFRIQRQTKFARLVAQYLIERAYRSEGFPPPLEADADNIAKLAPGRAKKIAQDLAPVREYLDRLENALTKIELEARP